MSGLVWEEPPTPRSGQSASEPDWVAELKSKPGRWARVAEHPFEGNQSAKAAGAASALATRIRHGRARFWKPAGSFEAVSRRVGSAYYVYVRYIGERS